MFLYLSRSSDFFFVAASRHCQHWQIRPGLRPSFGITSGNRRHGRNGGERRAMPGIGCGVRPTVSNAAWLNSFRASQPAGPILCPEHRGTKYNDPAIIRERLVEKLVELEGELP